MRFNTKSVLSILVALPSTLAALNGACSYGKKGICVKTSTCKNYGGTISNGNCPNDPNDVKCCSDIPCQTNNLTGSCKFINECDGTTYSGLCPGGNDFKCCVKIPGVGSSCTDQNISGTCINVSTTVCNTYVATGKCPGPANVKCCLSKKPNVSCSDISLFSTNLTKSQFTSALKNYASSSTSNGIKNFASNAEKIYDISIQNNFNPEMVVVRAMSEGFSPGGSTYNYWGLGCYNGQNSCLSYSSFDKGVLAFILNIKNNNYATVQDMMLKYAYIGKYWYNPGSSSLGGCYYYPYIKQYLSQSRSNQVQQACSGATCTKNEASCVPTTQEDQNAYAKRNVVIMVNNRNKIFNISC